MLLKRASRGRDPDPLVRDEDPDPDPSIIKQKFKKTFSPTVFLLLYDFLSLKSYVNVPSKIISKLEKIIIFCCCIESHRRNSRVGLDPLVRGTDPYQNVTDPQHYSKK